MSISNVRIHLLSQPDGLIGFASLLINDGLYLSSIGIYKKKDGKGLRLTYPSRGKYKIFYPINKEMAHKIEKSIFDKISDVVLTNN